MVCMLSRTPNWKDFMVIESIRKLGGLIELIYRAGRMRKANAPDSIVLILCGIVLQRGESYLFRSCP